MKKIRYKFLLVLLSILVYSCDLDTVPTTSVGDEKPYKSLQDVEYIINGTWSYLWETYNTYACPGWSTLLMISDFMGSDVVEIGKYGYSGVYQYTVMSSGTSTHVVQVWRLAYKAIDNMNGIITRIDNVEGDDDDYRARIKSQAYALRGYMYLNLATYYAHAYSLDPNQKCAPIYLEPTDKETVGKSRSTLAQVYEQAEKDLLTGYENIGDYNRPKKYKINKEVIAGLLARLYLQTEDWENAQKYAELAHNGYKWMAEADYLAGFNELSNVEWIWGQGSSTDQNVSSSSFDFKDVYSASSSYYSMMADPYFMELFNNDEGDIRLQLFEWQTNSRSPGYLMYKKFLYRSNNTADVVIMRKAEMVLIEAEALAEQNLLSQSITKLNELREARGAQTPDLSALSKEDLIEEILIERRKELFGEGFSLSDIKRRQKSVVRKDYSGNGFIPETTIKKEGHSATKLPDGSDFVVNSPYYIFTIPASEYTNNPNL